MAGLATFCFSFSGSFVSVPLVAASFRMQKVDPRLAGMDRRPIHFLS